MVRAAIVHDDDFPTRIHLSQHAVDRIGQIDGGVVSRHDDTYTGRHLQTASSSAAISLSTGSSSTTSTGRLRSARSRYLGSDLTRESSSKSAPAYTAMPTAQRDTAFSKCDCSAICDPTAQAANPAMPYLARARGRTPMGRMRADASHNSKIVTMCVTSSATAAP